MDSKLTVSFSGHETFPFRYAWLKKGYDGVVDNPTLFSQEDQAMVILGVGKNMVRAIRHWCLATSVLEPMSNEKRGGHGHQPSPFGTLLFHDENGADPYLEDTVSLWALHWHIASSPDRCTTWNWAFSHIHEPEFSKEQMLDSLTGWIATHDIKRVSENTLERDIDCFIRTYCPSRNRNQAVIEESLDCPLTELGLLHETTGRSFYRFHRGKKDDMPPGVLLYAITNYWESVSPHANSLSLADIAYSPGSPGRVFQMDEHSMANVLEDAENLSQGKLRYDDTSGLRQLLRKGKVHPQKLLKQAYSRHGATRRKVTVHATR